MNFSAGSVVQLLARVADRHDAVDHRRPGRREQDQAHDHAERLQPLRNRVVVQVMRARPDVAVHERPEARRSKAGSSRSAARLASAGSNRACRESRRSAGSRRRCGRTTTARWRPARRRTASSDFPSVTGNREAVHDVQHRDDDDQRAVEPVRDVDRPRSCASRSCRRTRPRSRPRPR